MVHTQIMLAGMGLEHWNAHRVFPRSHMKNLGDWNLVATVPVAELQDLEGDLPIFCRLITGYAGFLH